MRVRTRDSERRFESIGLKRVSQGFVRVTPAGVTNRRPPTVSRALARARPARHGGCFAARSVVFTHSFDGGIPMKKILLSAVVAFACGKPVTAPPVPDAIKAPDDL